jgi:uncharacterized protein YeaC (DUF1315 family)
MNILQLKSETSELKLSSIQKQKCGQECLAYINPNAIGITTCGTYIDGDHVLPQKQSSKVQFTHNLINNSVILQAQVDGQTVHAITHKTLIDNQNLLQFCKTKYNPNYCEKVYTDCDHIKLLLSAKDIILGYDKKK